ncbi:cysteinyl leukotriene receptor 1 [Prionailurus viverrinus]|uniref:cysteinyl leukotriene receptor 1 n=1 Tax=Prionailurus viverrinus TaxID=61388 RepID=UPI001FF4085C|nr:cysteinyl leukotriene receptor 1 [Prionailurus viverrinus]XP_047700776.1 cysteinyl leukotriene receptor 1 [Prionailurus viverrinus]XP_047700777.1 cysteinyl leukotriene receptor 1 [Prionailurus viverrinus]XP_047700778.1 cysteinyl leukotriene receptor 1 [Prionailurus viverrinus]XP_047700779.1 cysteinyl leukotriene receptor 1 [Prionailurus viverrinus]
MDGVGNLTVSSASNNTCNDTIDDFRNQVYSTLYSMISVVGFFGNSFVLYVLIKTYHEKSAFQVYMINLAVADLLCVCTLPLRVVYYVHKGIWLFGDFLCRLSTYALYVNLYCSIFFMTAMSFFRCIAIVFPVQNINLVKHKKAKFVCVGIWIFVILTSSPFLMSTSYKDEKNNTKCFEPPQDNQAKNHVLVLHYVSLFVGFIIPFVIIIVCYTMIILTLLKNSMNKNLSSRKKAIGMIIVVTAAFLISFMPYHIQRTIHLHLLHNETKPCDSVLRMQKSVVITLSLAASNCCFDPLLYFFSGGNFRRRLSTIRKHSLSSVTYVPKKKASLPEKEEEICKE